MSETPGLKSAKQRTARAMQHVQALNSAHAVVAMSDFGLSASIDRAPFEEHHEVVNLKLEWDDATPAVRIAVAEVGLLVGEVLYHSRTALDYFVYNLAWLDSGKEQKNTQFPIESDPARWADATKRRLKGVKQAHADVLKKYQPFTGCSWTGDLQSLSNRDKHRSVVQVPRQHEAMINVSDSTVSVHPYDPARLAVALQDPTSGFVLEDGRSPVTVLQHMVIQVANLLDEHQHWFGENDTLVTGHTGAAFAKPQTST